MRMRGACAATTKGGGHGPGHQRACELPGRGFVPDAVRPVGPGTTRRSRQTHTHTHNLATVTETPQADPPWRGRLPPPPPPPPHPHPLATFRSPEDRVRTRVRPRSSRCASIVGTPPPSSNSFPSREGFPHLPTPHLILFVRSVRLHHHAQVIITDRIPVPTPRRPQRRRRRP